LHVLYAQIGIKRCIFQLFSSLSAKKKIFFLQPTIYKNFIAPVWCNHRFGQNPSQLHLWVAVLTYSTCCAKDASISGLYQL